jgi:hypothetical protein
MEKKNEVTPKDYDRWGRTCIKMIDPPKKETKTPKKAVKTVKKGK